MTEPWPSKSATALQLIKGVDMRDKYVVVTGANTGIGFETARALAHTGAHVVLACRNAVAANEAKDRIAQDIFEFGEVAMSVMKLDCASFASVRTFVREYRKTGWPLHLLILNAGIFGAPGKRITEDGLEITFQVNHLSQYHIAWELRDLLKASAPSRVVFVSSEAHRSNVLFASHLNWAPESITPEMLSPSEEKMSGTMHAYGISKLCNVLAALYYNKEMESHGVTAYSLHPGFVKTEVARSMGTISRSIVTFLHNIVAKNAETGASTTVFCALDPRLDKQHAGEYFDNNRPRLASAAGQRQDNAAKLHDVSMQMIAELKERQ